MSGRRNYTERAGKSRKTRVYERFQPEGMSGFIPDVRIRSSKKHNQKANDFIGSTPKPDRITEGQKGWNLEPLKGRFQGEAAPLQPLHRRI
jgi:hypothetical protein